MYNGNTGGYPSAGYPTPKYPPNATEADKDVMRVPLISIALQGNSLYVTDAIGGRILKYDKTSGNYQSTISGIPVACGVAIAPNGNIWVGHEHTKVSVYSASGVQAGHAHHRSDGGAGAFHPGQHVGGCRPGGEDPQIHN